MPRRRHREGMLSRRCGEDPTGYSVTMLQMAERVWHSIRATAIVSLGETLAAVTVSSGRRVLNNRRVSRGSKYIKHGSELGADSVFSARCLLEKIIFAGEPSGLTMVLLEV